MQGWHRASSESFLSRGLQRRPIKMSYSRIVKTINPASVRRRKAPTDLLTHLVRPLHPECLRTCYPPSGPDQRIRSFPAFDTSQPRVYSERDHLRHQILGGAPPHQHSIGGCPKRRERTERCARLFPCSLSKSGTDLASSPGHKNAVIDRYSHPNRRQPSFSRSSCSSDCLEGGRYLPLLAACGRQTRQSAEGPCQLD